MAIQKIPLWKENENWRNRQLAMRDYMDAMSQLTTNLTSAGSDQSSGIANIVAKAAMKRIQAEAAAKNAKSAAESAQAAANDKALQAIKDRMNEFTKVDVIV